MVQKNQAKDLSSFRKNVNNLEYDCLLRIHEYNIYSFFLPTIVFNSNTLLNHFGTLRFFSTQPFSLLFTGHDPVLTTGDLGFISLHLPGTSVITAPSHSLKEPKSAKVCLMLPPAKFCETFALDVLHRSSPGLVTRRSAPPLSQLSGLLHFRAQWKDLYARRACDVLNRDSFTVVTLDVSRR